MSSVDACDDGMPSSGLLHEYRVAVAAISAALLHELPRLVPEVSEELSLSALSSANDSCWVWARSAVRCGEQLLVRAVCFLRQAELVRCRSARESEDGGALFGHDPVTLSELALHDADAAKDALLRVYRHSGAQQPPNKPSTEKDAREEGSETLPHDQDSLVSDAGVLLQEAHLLRIRAAESGVPHLLPTVIREALDAFPMLEEAHAAAVRCHVAISSTDSAAVSTVSGAVGNDVTDPSMQPGLVPCERFPRADSRSADLVVGEVRRRLRDVLDCSVCSSLLVDPVTTPCGHSFCRQCLVQVLDHSSTTTSGPAEAFFTAVENVGEQRCPLCRAPLHMDAWHHPPSVTLTAVIDTAFAAELAERRRELDAAVRGIGSLSSPAQRQAMRSTSATTGLSSSAPSQVSALPLFVMSLAFPFHPGGLNVFEPRYRLLMRRCLQGSQCFGMLSYAHVVAAEADAESGTSEPQPQSTLRGVVGTMVRISHSTIQPDGRLTIQYAYEGRFVIERSWDLDGYRVAQVRLLVDAPLDDAAAPVLLRRVEEVLATLFTRVQLRLPSAVMESLRASTAEKKSLFIVGLFVAQGIPEDHELVKTAIHTTSLSERLECIDRLAAAVSSSGFRGRCSVA